MNRHGVAITIVGASIFACGCAQSSLEEASEHVDTGEHAIESINRLTMNGLSSNRLTMNGLSSGRLSLNGSALVNTNLLHDELGRELLTYVARCALGPNQTLVGTHQGVSYTFSGLLGLASSWLHMPLSSVAQQRWVSACLLAHVNGYGVEVPISLGGAHAALHATETEKATFTVQETAFFGNVFAVYPGEDDEEDDEDDEEDDDEEDESDLDNDDDEDSAGGAAASTPLRFYACGGENLRAQCTGGGALRPQRSCAQSASCSLVFPGVCKAPTGQSGNACKSTSPSGGFTDCHPTLSNASGQWASNSQKYEEIITVYLRPSDFNSLYPTCTSVAE